MLPPPRHCALRADGVQVEPRHRVPRRQWRRARARAREGVARATVRWTSARAAASIRPTSGRSSGRRRRVANEAARITSSSGPSTPVQLVDEGEELGVVAVDDFGGRLAAQDPVEDVVRVRRAGAAAAPAAAGDSPSTLRPPPRRGRRGKASPAARASALRERTRRERGEQGLTRIMTSSALFPSQTGFYRGDRVRPICVLGRPVAAGKPQQLGDLAMEDAEFVPPATDMDAFCMWFEQQWYEQARTPTLSPRTPRTLTARRRTASSGSSGR